MAKQRSKAKQQAKRARQESGKATAKAIRELERRIAALEAEQRVLRKRLKTLTKRLDDALGPRRKRERRGPRPPWARGGPPWAGGRPPWARGIGPVVSLEVPLEAADPAAPLWATVAARLPEEITAVGDDGRVVRYRYSAVGSTPQAPRYRPVGDPETLPDGSSG
ncbi:MAG: hypothetical protein AMXMBFR46_26960 [Acidimicrobiia bacterium]